MISFEQTVPWFKKNFFLQTNDLQKPSVLEKLLYLQVRENYYGDLNCDPPKCMQKLFQCDYILRQDHLGSSREVIKVK